MVHWICIKLLWELSVDVPKINHEEMQSKALSPRICDGVIDCQDLSDEATCSYFPNDHIHCGIGRVCIKNSKRCDGRKDCSGSDERAYLYDEEKFEDEHNIFMLYNDKDVEETYGRISYWNEIKNIEKFTTLLYSNFTAFKFQDKHRIYLTCNVEICYGTCRVEKDNLNKI